MTAKRNATLVMILVTALWLTWGFYGPFAWTPLGLESVLLVASWVIILVGVAHYFGEDQQCEIALQRSAASAKSWNTVALKYQKQVADLSSVQSAYDRALVQNGVLAMEIEELRGRLRETNTRAETLSSARGTQRAEYANLQALVKTLLSPLRVILKRSPVFMTKAEKKFITRSLEDVSRRHSLAAVRDTFPGIPVPPTLAKKTR